MEKSRVLATALWIDMELFLDYYFFFLSYAPPIRPLLIMDGHSSHFCPEVITAAAAEKVILCALPPHIPPICFSRLTKVALGH